MNLSLPLRQSRDRFRGACVISLLAATIAAPLHAQSKCPDSTASSQSRMVPLRTLDDWGDDRRRLLEDLGLCPSAGRLMRSASTLNTYPASPERIGWTILSPTLRTTYNSQLPFSMNDGAAFSGRGLTTTIKGGVRATWGLFAAIVAPQVIYEQNRPFPIEPSPDTLRSSFASPWFSGQESADLPLRFGDQPNLRVGFGESSMEARVRYVRVGASTESQWWGPGVRNAIVLSDNAAGVPSLYLKTNAPIATRFGKVEAKWLVGGLTESPYYRRDTLSEPRYLSAVIATLQLAADTGLTLGVARAVYGNTRSWRTVPGHFTDVLWRWNQRAVPDSLLPSQDSLPRPASEQILSFFGRWVFPADGLEAYAEWATLFPPASLRELLVSPQVHQGYTVGLQWAKPLDESIVRVQAEATDLEQTPSTFHGVVQSFYVSPRVRQGYTQRGQVLGAAIGPGSSSQWLASDYLAPTWRAGVELGRIRWQNDAYYLHTQSSSGYYAHDVSIFAGVSGGVVIAGNELRLELIRQKRYSYLFQSSTRGYAPDRGFDIPNTTLTLSITPSFSFVGLNRRRESNR